jgi:hypothetical protein
MTPRSRITMQPASMSAATTTRGCQALIFKTILTPDPAEEQTLALPNHPSAMGLCQNHTPTIPETAISHAHRVDPDKGQPRQCLAGGVRRTSQAMFLFRPPIPDISSISRELRPFTQPPPDDPDGELPLSPGQLTAVDTLTIEVVQAGETPAVVIIRWPAKPYPHRFPAVAEIAARTFAAAIVKLAQLKRERRR